MLKKTSLLMLLTFSVVFAKENISIDELLKANYSEEISIEKKSLILTKEQSKSIQKAARAKVDSKIVRYYEVKKEDKIMGHSILLKQKIRTKNAAILYMVDENKTMIGVEIISFKEPSEYKPNDDWRKIFVGKTSEDILIAGKDIPTISGATLSARAISDAARVALAIATEKF